MVVLKKTWTKGLAALALVPLLALTACSGQGGKPADTAAAGGGGQVASTPQMTVAMVTHAQLGDTFWDIVRKGAEAAAAKDNVKLLYTSDSDPSRQAQLVQQAVDQKVDGLAVTLATPDAMKDVLKNATSAGIPIVSFNAGEASFSQLGAFTYIGSDETLAGQTVGSDLVQQGFKHPICVIQAQGQVQLQQRCAGVKEKEPDTEILYVNGADMSSVESTVTAKLQADKSADVIVGLGAPDTVTIVKAVADANSSIKVASFDLNPALAQEISDGKVLFTVDQQPWLEGYMSVDTLWQYKYGGFKLGGGQPVLTGPAIVDKSNISNVLKYVQQGIR
jgi:simple sugar transport system substrate-binding protein